MGVFRPCVNRMVSRQMCCKEMRSRRWKRLGGVCVWVCGCVCVGGGGGGEKKERTAERNHELSNLGLFLRGDFISCDSLLLERSLLLFYRSIIFAMSARQLYTSRPDQHNGASLPRKMSEK